tara:strand:+ start:9260 stop:9874 length:615 start_codon:yes stop_codon:yes gene_type:complete
MKANAILNQIKEVLGMELSTEKKEVELATLKLDNGTRLQADEFSAGNEVFILGEEKELIALPKGEYTLEDARILSVIDEGLIAEIKEAGKKDEKEVEEKVEASKEVEEPTFASIEDLTELKSMIEELKSMIDKKEDLKEEVKEELSEVKQIEVKEAETVELEVAEKVEPIAHNPEAESTNKSATANYVSANQQLIHDIISQYNN